MTSGVVATLLIPLATAMAGLAAWRRDGLQGGIAVAGSLAHVAASAGTFLAVWRDGIAVVDVGGWPAPFGITLAVDLLGALMLVLTAVLGLAAGVTSLVEVDAGSRRHAFFPLLQVLLFGVSGAFMTGDLFNLFVFFEVMLMASFVLLALGGGGARLEAAVKYVGLNLFSSMLFLLGAGTAYGLTGTLNLADLQRTLPEAAGSHPAAVLVMGSLLLLSFGVKAGIFPLYFWLPASYHTAPPAVSAIFAGLLTKVGLYALIRLGTMLQPASAPLLRGLLAVAAATMVMGVLGAVAQTSTRRILGFHILSQIGYILVGVGLLYSGDPGVRRIGLAATVFYLAHHILVKTNLYLVAGVARKLLGGEDLAASGGLFRRAPWLVVGFLIPAFSLAGLPPFSGFWAKLAVLRSGIDGGAWIVVGTAAAAGLLTLVSMLKIWNEVFWKEPPAGVEPRPPLAGRERLAHALPILALAAGTLAIGLAPGWLYSVADRAAGQLLDPSAMVEAVQPAPPPPAGPPPPGAPR